MCINIVSARATERIGKVLSIKIILILCTSVLEKFHEQLINDNICISYTERIYYFTSLVVIIPYLEKNATSIVYLSN